MFLPGSLRTTTLGDVLGKLHRSRISGVLELIGHDAPFVGKRHTISLRQGCVLDVDTPLPVAKIGEVLLADGALTSSEHEGFVNRLTRSGRRAGELLVGMRLVTDGGLSAGLKTQRRLRLDALCTLKTADIRFHPMGSRAPQCPPEPLEPRDFLHGRPRARDASAASCTQDASEAPEEIAGALRLLDLQPGARRAEIRSAFRRLAVLAHPDLHTTAKPEDRTALQRRFADLSQAYHLLITAAR